MTLREQLMRDEGGYRRFAYEDSEGYWTIGFGRCVDRRKGKGISLAEAEAMLDHDISEFTAGVVAALPWAMRLDDARREVLVNLAFNMGVGGLLTFKHMLAALEQGDHEGAARELLDSKYARQVGLRAERLARQLVTGDWQ